MFFAVAPPLLAPCIEDRSESPIRKVLSPISSNVMALKQQTADDVTCPPSVEPKTPIGEYHMVEKIPGGTPLDKFNALGSNLKVCMIFLIFCTSATYFSSSQISKCLYLTQESLIQQYLELLNVANK
jgi:hypothetical protein